ncbi:hypothetical protein BH09GEM1_BH09GEM1_11210 [soil metagenome]
MNTLPAITLPDITPQPRHPDRLRDPRIEREVMVPFTVNEAGRADRR